MRANDDEEAKARECKRINKWMRLATFQRLKYPGTGNEFMENNPVFGTGEKR